MLNRRKALALGGAVGAASLFIPSSATSAPSAAGVHTGHLPRLTPARRTGGGPVVTPFRSPMPLPPSVAPVSTTGGIDLYRIPIRPAKVEIFPGTTTDVLSFGGAFMGPLIRAKAGRRVGVVFTNQLGEAANVHLHGGHTAANSDGHPMDVIEPGGSKPYEYLNRQRGATLWYHAHEHHTEAEHVYRGMHGFYVIDDDAECDLRLPAGPYDVPIMLRDALFDDQHQLVYDDPGNRPTILVNGKVQPFFRVAARKYRFRLLNASTERAFDLRLEGASMTQIASDGGLLPAPVPRPQVGLWAGERVEVVVDFAQVPIGGHVLLLDGDQPLLRFDVVRRVPDGSRLPDRLRPLPPLPAPTVFREVAFNIDFTGDPLPVAQVNGQPYDPERVDFRVRRGTTEVWTVRNADPVPGPFPVPHNFHLHMTQFRVLSRNGGPITLDDAGLKDTVALPPGHTVQVQATFEDFLGQYVFHCHFLEHSWLGMMAQMLIVE